jgi:hypothetical protein
MGLEILLHPSIIQSISGTHLKNIRSIYAVIEPEQLNDFLYHIKDIKGYLTALQINFLGAEEKIAPYQAFLFKLGREDVDPVDFYEMLLELRAVLGVMVTGYPETEGEIMPCVKAIDDLRAMLDMTYG